MIYVAEQQISEQYDVTVDNSTLKILTKLLDQQRKQSWVAFFLSEKIDCKKIKMIIRLLEPYKLMTMICKMNKFSV